MTMTDDISNDRKAAIVPGPVRSSAQGSSSVVRHGCRPGQ
jgi:hypothetical protein